VATAGGAALVVSAGWWASILGITVAAPKAAGSLGSSTTAVYAAVAAAERPAGRPGDAARGRRDGWLPWMRSNDEQVVKQAQALAQSFVTSWPSRIARRTGAEAR
jgi:hypothetical protein